MNIQKFLKKNKQICCIIAIIILYFLFKNINIERFLVGGQGVEPGEGTCGVGPHVINGVEWYLEYPCSYLDNAKVFNESHKDTLCGDGECSNKDIDICCKARNILPPTKKKATKTTSHYIAPAYSMPSSNTADGIPIRR